jgi:hypothetical protein
MIYVTGDTHGDFRRLSSSNFVEGKTLTKDDYVIILGDFGLIWSFIPDKEENWWCKWLNDKPWTTLFLDGNHENFDRLNKLETVTRFNNDVGKYSDSIYHLRRGRIYTIDNVTLFAFGGAVSIDKALRTPYLSWWPDELPNHSEMSYGINELEKHNYNVNFILTHDTPSFIPKYFYRHTAELSPLNTYFDYVYDNTVFDMWYAGHYHEEGEFDSVTLLYKSIKSLNTM